MYRLVTIYWLKFKHCKSQKQYSFLLHKRLNVKFGQIAVRPINIFAIRLDEPFATSQMNILFPFGHTYYIGTLVFQSSILFPFGVFFLKSGNFFELIKWIVSLFVDLCKFLMCFLLKTKSQFYCYFVNTLQGR